MNAFILIVEGGLGDIFFQVFCTNYFSCSKKYTEILMNKYVKLLIVSHNPSSKDLFKGQDWIDEVKQVEYDGNYNIKYKHEIEGFKKIDTHKLKEIQDEELEIYLSNEEKKQLDEITKEPYIILHPFAGLSDRVCFSKELMKDIIKQSKYKVCLIGANYKRKTALFADTKHIIEKNPFPNNKKIVDLIDKLSIRQLIELCKHKNCNHIYCTHSSTVILAWYFKKSNTCYYPLNGDVELLIKHKIKNQWNFGKNYKFTNMVEIDTQQNLQKKWKNK